MEAKLGFINDIIKLTQSGELKWKLTSKGKCYSTFSVVYNDKNVSFHRKITGTKDYLTVNCILLYAGKEIAIGEISEDEIGVLVEPLYQLGLLLEFNDTKPVEQKGVIQITIDRMMNWFKQL